MMCVARHRFWIESRFSPDGSASLEPSNRDGIAESVTLDRECVPVLNTRSIRILGREGAGERRLAPAENLTNPEGHDDSTIHGSCAATYHARLQEALGSWRERSTHLRTDRCCGLAQFHRSARAFNLCP